MWVDPLLWLVAVFEQLQLSSGDVVDPPIVVLVN
jgi:hypothetical protein